MVRPAQGLPIGTDVSRFLMALHARTKNEIASNILTRDWRDTPQVAAAFDLQGKASVPAGSTLDTVWAGALAEAGIGPTALTLVRGFSIVGAAGHAFSLDDAFLNPANQWRLIVKKGEA